MKEAVLKELQEVKIVAQGEGVFILDGVIPNLETTEVMR